MWELPNRREYPSRVAGPVQTLSPELLDNAPPFPVCPKSFCCAIRLRSFVRRGSRRGSVYCRHRESFGHDLHAGGGFDRTFAGPRGRSHD